MNNRSTSPRPASRSKVPTDTSSGPLLSHRNWAQMTRSRKEDSHSSYSTTGLPLVPLLDRPSSKFLSRTTMLRRSSRMRIWKVITNGKPSCRSWSRARMKVRLRSIRHRNLRIRLHLRNLWSMWTVSLRDWAETPNWAWANSNWAETPN